MPDGTREPSKRFVNVFEEHSRLMNGAERRPMSRVDLPATILRTSLHEARSRCGDRLVRRWRVSMRELLERLERMADAEAFTITWNERLDSYADVPPT